MHWVGLRRQILHGLLGGGLGALAGLIYRIHGTTGIIVISVLGAGLFAYTLFREIQEEKRGQDTNKTFLDIMVWMGSYVFVALLVKGWVTP